jgi:hypothetical protein
VQSALLHLVTAVLLPVCARVDAFRVCAASIQCFYFRSTIVWPVGQCQRLLADLNQVWLR